MIELLAGVLIALSPVTEDSPGWDCTTMGNMVCGPSNEQGVPAGQYDHGVLITSWEGMK